MNHQQLSNQEQQGHGQGQRQQDQEQQEDQQEGEPGYQVYHHPRPRTGGVSHPFPRKLHSLLESQVHEDIISWQLDGTAFTIHKPQDFVAVVLPKVFNQQTKLKSFQRQLSFYNFKRITSGPDSGAYRHPLFRRGMPHLCRNIIRDPFTKAAGATIRRIAHSTSNNTSSGGQHLGVTRTPLPTTSTLLMQEEERQQQQQDDDHYVYYDHLLSPNQRVKNHHFLERMERSPFTPSNLLDFYRSSKLPAEQLLPNNNSVSPLVEGFPLCRPLQYHSNGSDVLCSSPAAPPINNGNNNDSNIKTNDAADTSTTTFTTKERIDEAIREAVENVNEAIRKSLENFHSSLQTIANECFTASHSDTVTDHMLEGSSTTSTTMMSSITTTTTTTSSSSSRKNETKSSSSTKNDNSKLSISSDAPVNNHHQNVLRNAGEYGLSVSSHNPLLLSQSSSFDSHDNTFT